MYYILKTLKENNDETLNYDILVESDSPDNAKVILSEYKLIVLWVEELKQNQDSFGNLVIFVAGKSWEYKFIIKTENNNKTLKELITAKMDIKKCYSLDGSITQDSWNDLLQSIKSDIEEEDNKRKEEKLNKSKEETSKFKDKKYEKILSVVKDTLEDVETIKNNYIWLWSKELKTLDENVEELKKQRMWSNTEKIVQTLDKIFKIIDKVEQQNKENNQANASNIILNSEVSDLDVFNEYNKYKKAQRVHQTWASKNSEDNYYITTWKMWLFLRFIKKDFSLLFTESSNIVSWTLRFIQMMIIFLAMTLAVYILLQEINNSFITENVYWYLIKIWVLWFSMTITKIIQGNNLVMVALRFSITLLLYFVIINFINVNFAL